ncbi:MAG: hypothetical protein ACTSPM_10570 [Candidatus Heimdallarchaeota archaeon]
MNSKKFYTTMFVMALLAIVIQMSFSSPGTFETAGFKGEKPIVIFDVAHQTSFNNTHMQSALDLLETKYDAEVIINEDNFTLTNLRGADLLILPAPYYLATDPYSDLEKLALAEFIQDSGSVLFMANPFIFEDSMRNFTSHTNYLNSMMDGTYGELSFQPRNTLMLNDFSYRFDDQRFIYLDNSSFDTQHSIITGNSEIDEAIDELLTFTTSISATGVSERIVTVPETSYYLEYTDENTSSIPVGAVSNHTILNANEKYGGRAISVCSGIMFSDIEIPGANMTWYEAYDNALLWENMISWLFFKLPVNPPTNPVPEFWIFTLSIMGGFLVLFVFGLIFFTAGKETKRVEVSEALQKMREKDSRHESEEKEIEEAFYAEDDIEDEVIEEDEPVEEVKEVDMKSISDQVKKKPPKARSRSDRRRQD